MEITTKLRDMTIAGAKLRIGRTAEGVVEIHADHHLDLMRGLGFVHAVDRLTQMSLVRLVGQGRLCECLDDRDETLAIDIFMRQLGFAHLARDEAERCTPEARQFATAYAEGVNDYLRRHARPWGLRLAGCRPEPWKPADTLLTILLMSYVGLAQTQQDLEKFLIQALQAGVDRARLQALFAPHLDGLTDELVELIGKVQVVGPVVEPFPAILPTIVSSNNWAVSPWKSATGAALACHDPHLECNRLPAVWYEVVLRTPDDYQIGVTMPGVPGLIMGRTRNVSAGFTYGFMDMTDYFIEECRGGNVRSPEGWRPLRVRKEVIQRRKRAPVEISVFETEQRLLETDPRMAAPPEGFYLSRAFSAAHGGTARSLQALARWPLVRTVAEAQSVLREVSISGNWVLSDRAGNIGYQQSGLLPDRQHSGLHPAPGWDDTAAWRGIVPADRLASKLNPPEGYIVTANDDWNLPDHPRAINACQGPYRAERIRELLAEKEKLTLADMQSIQSDRKSTQARRFMEVIRPLLPETPAGRELKTWNLHYDRNSRGASRFEAIYARLLSEVFGAGLFGREAWNALRASTNLFGIYFHRFDQILLDDSPERRAAWFGHRSRDEILRSAIASALDDTGPASKAWGAQRQVVMRNLLLGGKLPRWLNRLVPVDYGPIALEGNSATVVQGAIFQSHGRLTTIAPSYRFVSDMGTDEAHTALAGGPSERPWSGWYTTDIPRWLSFEYKTLRGTDTEGE